MQQHLNQSQGPLLENPGQNSKYNGVYDDNKYELESKSSFAVPNKKVYSVNKAIQQ